MSGGKLVAANSRRIFPNDKSRVVSSLLAPAAPITARQKRLRDAHLHSYLRIGNETNQNYANHSAFHARRHRSARSFFQLLDHRKDGQRSRSLDRRSRPITLNRVKEPAPGEEPRSLARPLIAVAAKKRFSFRAPTGIASAGRGLICEATLRSLYLVQHCERSHSQQFQRASAT